VIVEGALSKYLLSYSLPLRNGARRTFGTIDLLGLFVSEGNDLGLLGKGD
jgi:hypothetical protein